MGQGKIGVRLKRSPPLGLLVLPSLPSSTFSMSCQSFFWPLTRLSSPFWLETPFFVTYNTHTSLGGWGASSWMAEKIRPRSVAAAVVVAAVAVLAAVVEASSLLDHELEEPHSIVSREGGGRRKGREEGEVCPCMLTSRIIPPSRFVLQGKKFKTAKSMVVHGGLSILVRVNKSLKSHNFMFILRGRGETQNKLFNRKIHTYSLCQKHRRDFYICPGKTSMETCKGLLERNSSGHPFFLLWEKFHGRHRLSSP